MSSVSQMEFIRSIRKHPLLLRYWEMDECAAAAFDRNFSKKCAKYDFTSSNKVEERETTQAPRNNT